MQHLPVWSIERVGALSTPKPENWPRSLSGSKSQPEDANSKPQWPGAKRATSVAIVDLNVLSSDPICDLVQLLVHVGDG